MTRPIDHRQLAVYVHGAYPRMNEIELPADLNFDLFAGDVDAVHVRQFCVTIFLTEAGEHKLTGLIVQKAGEDELERDRR